jgi:hypothetical protein
MEEMLSICNADLLPYKKNLKQFCMKDYIIFVLGDGVATTQQHKQLFF